MRSINTVAAMLAAGTLSALAPPASATLTVKHSSGSEFESSEYSITNIGANLYEIKLMGSTELNTGQELTPDFVIQGSGGEDIDEILVEINTGSVIKLRIENQPSTNGINDVNSALETTLYTVLTTIELINIEGDLGSVDVDGIEQINVGGWINGPISAHGDGTNNVGGSGITALKNIGSVSATSGFVLGDITSEHGSIGELESQFFGLSVNTPITISAHEGIKSIKASNQIGADSPIYANISTSTPKPGETTRGPGGIELVECDIFDGTLITERLEIPTDSGNYTARVTMTKSFDGTIRIGESFYSGSEVVLIGGTPTSVNVTREIEVLDNDNFWGQVIVNANDGGHIWQDGEAKTPSVTLTGDQYAELPSAIGGGSIGLVPYSVHNQACFPAEGAVYDGSGSSLLTVELRFYGPVSLPTGPYNSSTFPFIIEYGGGSSWTPVPSQELLFDVSVDPNNPNVVLIAELNENGFGCDNHYRITPKSTVLSAGLDSSVSVRTNDPYEFIHTENGACGGGGGGGDPCQTECTRLCYFCDPGGGPGGEQFSVAGMSFSGTSDSSSKGAITDQLVVDENGALLKQWWVYPGPMSANADSGTKISKLNRPQAHVLPDLDRDGDVDGDDLSVLMNAFGCMECLDVDGDWDIDYGDLAVLAEAWTGASSPSVE